MSRLLARVTQDTWVYSEHHSILLWGVGGGTHALPFNKDATWCNGKMQFGGSGPGLLCWLAGPLLPV